MLLLESTTSRVYKVKVNTESLVKIFACCYMPITRVALLNYTLIKLKSLPVTIKVCLWNSWFCS